MVGKWRQVGGGTTADFLLGGYIESIITFRADGVLEVRRTFDEAGEISLVWRIGYRWNKDRSKLTLGSDPAGRPKPASLKGFVIEDAKVKALDATQILPHVIKCTRLKNGNIRLDGKMYSGIK